MTEAIAEAEEARSWTCASCDTLIEDQGPHCRSCAAYWADVDAGLYDEDWDITAGRAALAEGEKP